MGRQFFSQRVFLLRRFLAAVVTVTWTLGPPASAQVRVEDSHFNQAVDTGKGNKLRDTPDLTLNNGRLEEPREEYKDCHDANVLGTFRSARVGGGLAIGMKTYPRTLALADHELVLTFDDGPSAGTTQDILDALAAQCVKATFFLIGKMAEGYPALVRREIAEGHSIGHHTWSHPPVSLRGLSEIEGREEIERGIRADEQAGWGEPRGLSDSHFPFFRFPDFADTPQLMELLIEKHFTVFGADIWASDWNDMQPSAQLELLLARIEKAGRGIVLLHDTRRQTADMLPQLLRELKERKYRIVHLEPTPHAGTEIITAGAEWKSETEKINSRLYPLPAGSNPPFGRPSEGNGNESKFEE
jgi:peptidoglycan/xylan/chitin deacetylase (PgdA/CDA1 family)